MRWVTQRQGPTARRGARRGRGTPCCTEHVAPKPGRPLYVIVRPREMSSMENSLRCIADGRAREKPSAANPMAGACPVRRSVLYALRLDDGAEKNARV